MSARGGARGGAFPSAHVSGAVVVSLVAWRHQRRLAYVLVPITGSVIIATVYGRFHYVLDTLAGAALAIAVVAGYRCLRSATGGGGLKGDMCAVVVFQASAQPAPSLPDQRAADFAALDRFVRYSYAFLPTKATDWNRVISALTPRARAARDDTAWLHVLEEALDALYDGHTQLNTNAPDSWRPVPYGLWVQPNNGRYIVTAGHSGVRCRNARAFGLTMNLWRLTECRYPSCTSPADRAS